jgi:hypothetical protein
MRSSRETSRALVVATRPALPRFGVESDRHDYRQASWLDDVLVADGEARALTGVPVMWPRLTDLLDVAIHVEPAHRRAELRLDPSNRDQAAFWLAVHLAGLRCGNTPQYFNAWFARWLGGPAHPDALRECLEAFLGSESIGTAAAPASDDHLEGFVAEHIWHALTREGATGFVCPIRVDGPDWSVTDSGGDGLSIHRVGGTLVFRLWESKAHAANGEVRDVVNGACRQLTSHALRYLARFSLVGQALDDDELKLFYGNLVEHWRNSSQQAGSGIAVTTTGTAPVADSFGNLHSYWEFEQAEQRQGLLVVIDDYAAFAKSVREQLWKGL